MNKFRALLMLLMLAIGAWCASSGLAAEEIDGKIVKAGQRAVTVEVESDFVPTAGDRVRIGTELPGLDEFDLVALGVVSKVGDDVEVKILASFGTIEKSHLARIISENPKRRTEEPTDPRAAGKTVTVRLPAKAAWTSTGLKLREGDNLKITASGTIEAARVAEERIFYHEVTPAGRVERFDYLPEPKLPALSLLGKIGNGPTFLVGDSLRMKVGPLAKNNELRLGINDDDVTDNEGAWLVRIIIESATP